MLAARLPSRPRGPSCGRTCGPGRSPRRLWSSSPAGPWGRPRTQRSWLGARVFCLCVVRVVTVTKPLATWPSIWPGWWLRHPQPGKGSLKCVEVAVLGPGCSDGVGTQWRASPRPAPRLSGSLCLSSPQAPLEPPFGPVRRHQGSPSFLILRTPHWGSHCKDWVLYALPSLLPPAHTKSYPVFPKHLNLEPSRAPTSPGPLPSAPCPFFLMLHLPLHVA